MSKSAIEAGATACATSATRRAARIGRADFARVMGVDRSAVTRWVQRGMPSFEDGDLDPVVCADWVRMNVETHKLRGSLGARQLRDADTRRLQTCLIAAYSSADESAANYTAELLVPLLPEQTCRAVVARLLAKMRQGSIECLSDEVPPPAGCKSWADDERFQEAYPYEHEWEDLLKRHAAGELEVVGA